MQSLRDLSFNCGRKKTCEGFMASKLHTSDYYTNLQIFSCKSKIKQKNNNETEQCHKPNKNQ